MKNFLFVIFVTLTLVGTLCAGVHPVSAATNAETTFMDRESFVARLCPAGDLCDTNPSVLAPGDGSPMPVCRPGTNCNDNQFQLRAGDGSPMPVCRPGTNCNDNQFQLRAGDG
jgi:hypothetical protein